jgi:hypothetical protein
MLERILILVFIAVAIATVWAGLRLWRDRKLARVSGELLFAEIAPGGRPAVIAFSTPGCAECRTRQAPALARLGAMLGEQVTVRTLLAPEHPDLVDRLGLLTVPATVLLGAEGQVCHVNLGFVDTERLAGQLSRLCDLPRRPLAVLPGSATRSGTYSNPP